MRTFRVDTAEDFKLLQQLEERLVSMFQKTLDEVKAELQIATRMLGE